MYQKPNQAEFEALLSQKTLYNLDLSDLDLDGRDFSGCQLKNLRFVALGQSRPLRQLNFKGAKLEDLIFDEAELEACDFDQARLERVSFKRCQMKRCRFRQTQMAWSDFRYSEIDNATFEEAQINYCDFYRLTFAGVIIFRRARIRHSSLFYTYFNEAATIRRENLVGDRIVQEQRRAYAHFLKSWHSQGTGERQNDNNKVSDWSPDKSLRNRYADAEDIYKTLNGLWNSRGFLGDANWAYVKGKQMERRRMMADWPRARPWVKLHSLSAIVWNYASDWLFGYGENIWRIIRTYVALVFIFSFLIYGHPELSFQDYATALLASLKNMVAMTDDSLRGISPLVDFLNIIQTTLGILITGIFGFVLGNKIRNQ